MIVLRMAHGVRSHFTLRLSEWLMIYPAIGMWIAFQMQPQMFSLSSSFAVLDRWADEMTWAWLVLCCALARLVALTVNGSFKTFPYSPHMRLGAAFIGIAFWSQFALGFVLAYLATGSALSAVFAYTTFCLAELANIYRTWGDVAAGWSQTSRQGR